MIDEEKDSRRLLRPKHGLGASSSSMPRTPFLFLLAILLQASIFLSPCYAACNPQDQASLLSFFGNLSSSLKWDSATDCCLWEGIGCDDVDGGVVRLSLPYRGLAGGLSPSLANLRRLAHLNLSHNRLSGSLPAGFFSVLDQLEVLDLSYNSFNGELPFGSLEADNSSEKNFPIQILDLSSNRFWGEIPNNTFLSSALNMTRFNVSNNSFIGQVPSFICQRSPLTAFDLSYNDFSGDIPLGLGRCSKLQSLRAGFNNLSGPLPDEVYSLSELQEISFPMNHLSGTIDGSITTLTKLTVLELFSNRLKGVIPTDVGQLFNLRRLELHVNNLTGPLPPSLTNCTNLVVLNLRVNTLGGELSDFDFAPLQSLKTLDLGNNNFSGVIPRSLYSCKSLTAVRLASNNLTGEIAPEIANLGSLSFLSVSTNNLTNITSAIKNLQGCKNLTTLLVAKNFFNESLPTDGDAVSSDAFQNIQILGLGGCQFTGVIPRWIVKLKSLEVMDLSQNRIHGSIPGWLGLMPNLFYLDLSDNLISGKIPKDLCKLRALTVQKAYDEMDRSYLELPVFANPNNVSRNQQYNQLSSLPPAIYIRNTSINGSIPVELGRLKVLHVLELQHNKLSGSIPDQLSNLTNLERLDLSSNNLTGEIPASFAGLHFLSWFNVANNNLQGPVPSGGQFDTFTSRYFSGNPGLCGSLVQRSCPGPARPPPAPTRKRSNTKLLVGLVVATIFVVSLIIAALALWILSKRRIIPGGDSEKTEMEVISSHSFSAVAPETDKDMSLVLVFGDNGNDMKDFTIFDLLKATDNFNQENIIGCGGFGLVFKATLENGTKLAVKKLSGDIGLMEKEFKAEVEILSRAKHENLVSLQGYCVHEGSRILIYSYMENGSLDYWLHEKPDGASRLDWPTRLNIARGASCGLAYMHQVCEPHIVHRDIKSSNILLNEKFKAHVADFGLSRLILPYRTHVTTELVGTLGYIPPEYGQAWAATLRGDVYSFGVVMLELLTGKRPVEVFRPKMPRELVGWVQQMRTDGKSEEVFDPVLKAKGFEEEMLQVLDIACSCVNQNPLKRPAIQDVVDSLKNVGRRA